MSGKEYVYKQILGWTVYGFLLDFYGFKDIREIS